MWIRQFAVWILATANWPYVKHRHPFNIFLSVRHHLYPPLALFAMKRSASSKAIKLAAHASPFNSSVTLFEADDALGQSMLRRSKRVKLEESIPIAVPDMEDTITDQGNGSSHRMKRQKSQAKAPISPRKPKPIQQTLKTPHPSPPRWRDAYDAIKEMRSHIVAPVDTMGCDQAQLKEVDPKVSPHLVVPNSPLNEMAEPTLLDSCVAHVVISDKGRGD